MEQPASSERGPTSPPPPPDRGFVDVLLDRLDPRLGWLVLPWTVLVVLALAGPPVHDQELLFDSVDLRHQRFPSPDHGVASAWVFGLLELTGLTGTRLQVALQVGAAWGYLGGLALLARRWLVDPAHRALALLVVAASLYPYVWYSPDLLAAGLLFASLAALDARARPAVIGVLLALMGLTRPEMSLTAVALGAVWAWQVRPRPAQVASALGAAALVTGLMLAPPVAWYGVDYLDGARTYLDDSRQPQNEGLHVSRSLYAYVQHHAALVGSAGTPPGGPDPFGDWTFYLRRDFAGVTSVAEAVWRDPIGYLEFLARSVGRSASAAFVGLNALLLSLLGIGLVARAGGRPLRPRDVLLAVPLVALVPIVLITYLKVRYMARFFPLALVLVLAVRERMSGDDRADSQGGRLLRLGLDGTLLMQVVVTVLLLAFQVQLRGSGFPD